MKNAVKVKFVIIVLTAISVLCKEQGIMIIPIIILLRCVREDISALTILKEVLIYIPFLFGILLTRLWVMNFEPPKFQKGDNPTAFMESRFFRVINYQYIYLLNVYVIILPQWLCYDWAMGCISMISSITDPRFFMVIAFNFLVLCAILLKLRTRSNFRKPIFVSLIMGLMPFLPCSNILFTVGFVIAERNLYMPILGYAIFLAYNFNNLKKLKILSKRISSSQLFYFVIIMFIMKSIHRGFEWKTETDLFESGLKVCPNNGKIHYNLAKVSTDIYKAEWHYKKAIELWPSYEHALNNLGNLLKNKGQFKEAENYLLKVILCEKISSAVSF